MASKYNLTSNKKQELKWQINESFFLIEYLGVTTMHSQTIIENYTTDVLKSYTLMYAFLETNLIRNVCVYSEVQQIPSLEIVLN